MDELKNTSPKEELKQSLDWFIDGLRGFIDWMKDLEKQLEDWIKELETEIEKKKMEEKSQSDERVNWAINTLREVPEK